VRRAAALLLVVVAAAISVPVAGATTTVVVNARAAAAGAVTEADSFSVPAGTRAITISYVRSCTATGQISDAGKAYVRPNNGTGLGITGRLRNADAPGSVSLYSNNCYWTSSYNAYGVTDWLFQMITAGSAPSGTYTLYVDYEDQPTVTVSGTPTVALSQTGTNNDVDANVSGTVTANAGTGTFAVSGPLTDTQLRASSVPVTGPLTDAQLRATPVDVTGGGGGGGGSTPVIGSTDCDVAVDPTTCNVTHQYGELASIGAWFGFGALVALLVVPIVSRALRFGRP